MRTNKTDGKPEAGARSACEDRGRGHTSCDGAVQAFWDYSRFGQDKGAQEQAYLSRLHHGSGAAAQWTTRLPREVAEVYARDYGEALIALGYATDTDWVQSCPPAASLAA